MYAKSASTPFFDTNESLGSMEQFFAMFFFLSVNHSPNGVWRNDSASRFSFSLYL